MALLEAPQPHNEKQLLRYSASPRKFPPAQEGEGLESRGHPWGVQKGANKPFSAVFMAQAAEFWPQYKYPDFNDSKAKWKVWVLKPCRWFGHHSILFQSIETQKYFVTEVILTRKQLVLDPRHFDPCDPKYEGRWFVAMELGNITMAPAAIFQEMLETLGQVGSRDSEGDDSCLLYCQQLARNLDCVPETRVHTLIPEAPFQSWV